ncbi:secondary thiamine-phosphate synthase enzyme YjbQ [Kangiella shandongensis]|uniref:secondary thiamine-phosphate synthase enzyme YjbQ n=1 Tax=Kangiella shandongensis TaxID=2763258 RepID=UPI001CBAD9AD|nr:secondary thiamine-phosphate synthase enzyme YjbQ [Kangiella shandongensis]
MSYQEIIKVATQRQGLYEFTREVETWVSEQEVTTGVCHLFAQHTSCSLTIQENADPSAKADLENWLNRLVPENDPLYTHTMEGPDDMPAHIKAILTNVSLSIPIVNGRLALGTWQGIYLWEHRHHAQQRRIILHVSD